jgi:hypothetical protein
VPQLTIQVSNTDVLGQGIRDRLSRFAAADVAAQRAAAAKATDVARASFKRKRDIAPPRPGRSGRGQMTKGIQYSRVSGQSAVALRVKDLDAAAPHWIIQEIGTASTANIFRAEENGPQVARVATVPPQYGRTISSGLAWASQGRYVPPQKGGGTENLVPRIGPRYGNQRMVIRKEIEAQNFIQKGSEAGFREYQTSVLAAARRELRKRKTT